LTESKLQAYAFTEGDEQIVDKEFVTKVNKNFYFFRGFKPTRNWRTMTVGERKSHQSNGSRDAVLSQIKLTLYALPFFMDNILGAMLGLSIMIRRPINSGS